MLQTSDRDIGNRISIFGTSLRVVVSREPEMFTDTSKSLQSCPTLCDPIDGSPPGPPVPGILQARTLEWVAISFSNASSEKWKWGRSVVSDPQRLHGLQPTRLLHPWDFPGKSTGVGCHCLLRGDKKIGLCSLFFFFKNRFITVSLVN